MEDYGIIERDKFKTKLDDKILAAYSIFGLWLVQEKWCSSLEMH